MPRIFVPILQRLKRDWESGKPAATRGTGSPATKRAWWRGMAAIGGAVFCLLVGLVGAIIHFDSYFDPHASRSHPVDSVAVLPFVTTSVDTQFPTEALPTA